MYSIPINVQEKTFGLINQVLPKYIGCDAPCLVKFVLEVTEGDCENLATITKEKEIIRRESSQYITNDNIINNYLSREIEMLGQGEQYEYVIDNYTMKEPTGKAKAYLDYLRVSEGVNFICQEMDNVLEITGEKYSMWQQQDGFKALRGLMEIILHRNGILK